jgi:hypothetical protein
VKIVVILVIVLAVGFALYQAYAASQEENLEARTIKSLPPSVQHVVAQMDPASQASFFNEYDRKKKKRSVAYILWLTFGFHYLYARKVGMQFAFWFAWLFFVFPGVIWWWVDLFRVPSIVKDTNEQQAREALQTLHVGAAFASLPSATQLPAHSMPFMATSSPTSAQPPTEPGWYTDPAAPNTQRWWDGIRWTEHVLGPDNSTGYRQP